MAARIPGRRDAPERNAALGTVGAVFATRTIASELVAVGPADPVTFAIVACALLLVGLAAALIPAARIRHLHSGQRATQECFDAR